MTNRFVTDKVVLTQDMQERLRSLLRKIVRDSRRAFIEQACSLYRYYDYHISLKEYESSGRIPQGLTPASARYWDLLKTVFYSHREMATVEVVSLPERLGVRHVPPVQVRISRSCGRAPSRQGGVRQDIRSWSKKSRNRFLRLLTLCGVPDLFLTCAPRYYPFGKGFAEAQDLFRKFKQSLLRLLRRHDETAFIIWKKEYHPSGWAGAFGDDRHRHYHLHWHLFIYAPLLRSKIALDPIFRKSFYSEVLKRFQKFFPGSKAGTRVEFVRRPGFLGHYISKYISKKCSLEEEMPFSVGRLWGSSKIPLKVYRYRLPIIPDLSPFYEHTRSEYARKRVTWFNIVGNFWSIVREVFLPFRRAHMRGEIVSPDTGEISPYLLRGVRLDLPGQQLSLLGRRKE